jgi:signal transduction histidine kinase
MEYIEADLIVPIINNNKLISLFVLGSKKSGQSYTVQDINLLSTIANQASIAIENARLYREVSGFNNILQKKVNKATNKLKKQFQELKKANIRLKSLDLMKDQLIAVTSHELRTPASIVQNYLWMLSHKPDKTTVLSPIDKQNVERSFISIQTLIKLIDDILNVSRIEGGKVRLNLTAIDVKETVQKVIDELDIRIQNKGLKINYHVPKNKLVIRADLIKFSEILNNILTNAIKYTDTGIVSLEIKKQKSDILFEIIDTGRGIAKEHIKSLFKKFYREDTSFTSSNQETGGTGLGLYITKSLVELMKGTIGVKSTLGKGSTFWFTLPSAK